MAYYTSVPQEGILAEIRQGPQALAAVAVRGQKEIWPTDTELLRHIESHSSSYTGYGAPRDFAPRASN